MRRSYHRRSALHRSPAHEAHRPRSGRPHAGHPPCPARARVDGRHRTTLRLPLPAAGDRQRAWLGAALPVRLRGQLGRQQRAGGDHHQRRCRHAGTGDQPLRLWRADLPRPVPVPHRHRHRPVRHRAPEPAQGRHRRAERHGGNRLEPAYLHHELALHPARAGALRGGRAVLSSVPAAATVDRAGAAAVEAAVRGAAAGAATRRLDAEPHALSR